MKKLVSISLWALALLVGICLTACSRLELLDPSEFGAGRYYLEMSLNIPDTETTRATPTGGEEGDGPEDGKYRENDIDNITVFIFSSSLGFDADASTTFLYKGYFKEGDASCEWTTSGTSIQVKFPLSGYVPTDGDRVIVVANAGDISASVTTLGQLRDYTTYSSWTNGADITENNKFVMSSAYNNSTDGFVHVTSHDGSYTDPYVSELSIQRTAARIDFMYKDANVSGSELVYDVKDATDNILSKVHVQNIIPVNLMQESSYMIKRVTSSVDITSAVKYGALETASSGVPTNYVIEPHTLLKESTVADATLSTWYGSTRSKTIFADPTSYLTGTGISSYTSTAAATTDLGFEKSMILAYTNENTQSKGQNSPDFLTGLLLKAIYQPLKVYTDKDLTLYSPMSDYATGKTFWRYKPTKVHMSESDCLYFTTEAAALAYKADHAADLATITEYPGGVCYYTIWLRHANIELDPHDTFPMEYGIVRNNIYRVGIESYTGPGTALPAHTTPDNMYLRIFVRKWNLRKQPTIRL